jgi:ribonuclease T2
VVALIVAALFAWWQQRSNQPADAGTSARESSRSATAAAGSAGGEFDYYVLSLSWSPHHCATDGRDDEQQCGTQRRYEFIAHGLWPQYERGYPEECAVGERVSRQTLESMRDIMPSDGLIRHEWSKHGTCSGMDERSYFAAVRRAFDAIAIPQTFRGSGVRVQTSAEAVRSDFARANPGLDREEFALRCDGQYLAEVRVCMDKSLEPRRCGADVRSNCRANPLVVRPVR